MEENKKQVSIFNLVFTHNWEDPECDHTALQIGSGDSILAITSGGCNVLGFLLFDPARIYSVDINPTQSYLLELKICAIRNLSYQEFIFFMGLSGEGDRLSIYSGLKKDLSSEARLFWDANEQIISKGLIMNGKYERFISFAGRFMNFLQGSGRVRRLFMEKTQEEQVRYFDEVWNTRRFQYLFKILFNKRMLARRGLVADYFHFDDGAKSFAESFYNRSKKALRNLPIKGNYFLSLYLLGSYRNRVEVPAYLKAENYDRIKERIGRIKVVTSDAQSFADSLPSNEVDCFALSNICELMSLEETQRLFSAVVRTARKNARVIFRNLMVPREVPESLAGIIIKNHERTSKIFENDRSFVYGKVDAYDIRK